MNNMGYTMEYDDAMGLWAVLDLDERVIEYFKSKEEAESFVDGMKSFIKKLGE